MKPDTTLVSLSMRELDRLKVIEAVAEDRLMPWRSVRVESDWRSTTIAEFVGVLNAYVRWYNEKRIKGSLGYLSPIEYRESLGLAT